MLPLTPESMNCQTVFPDSANIFYTDANTKERIFLCANPNCTHADESCPSYIATPSAMFSRPCFCVLAISFWSSLLKPPTPVTRMGC